MSELAFTAQVDARGLLEKKIEAQCNDEETNLLLGLKSFQCHSKICVVS